MVRKVICGFLVFILAISFIACGKKDIAETTIVETQVETTVEETTRGFQESDYDKYKDLKLLIVGDSLIESCKNELREGFENCTIDTSFTELGKTELMLNAHLALGIEYDVIVLAVCGNPIETFRADTLAKICRKIKDKKIILTSSCMAYKGQGRNRDRKIKEIADNQENVYFLDINQIEKKNPNSINYETRQFSKTGAKEFVKLLKETIVKTFE